MNALIKGDFLSPRLSGYITLVVTFSLVHFVGFSPYSLFVLFTLTVLIALFLYDNYYKMDRFFKSMPIQPSKIILSRYVSSLMFIVGFVLIQVLFMTVNTLHPYSMLFYFYTWQDVIIVLCLGLILVSIVIPIFHLIKPIYLSLTFIGVLFFLGAFQTLDLLVVLTDSENFIDFNRLDTGYQLIVEQYIPGQPYVTLTFISIILVVISYFISVKTFKRKDLA